jgi:hypothetical protein
MVRLDRNKMGHKNRLQLLGWSFCCCDADFNAMMLMKGRDAKSCHLTQERAK